MAMNEDELIDYLQEAHTLKVTPDDLLTSIFTWINFDAVNRKCTLNTATSHINMKLCSKSVLQRHVNQHQAILEENPAFNSAVSNILHDETFPASPTFTTLSLVVASHEQCWKLSWNDPDDLTEFTKVPDCLSSSGMSLCVYEGIGLILTGGLGDVCAVYYATKNQWQTIEQTWLCRAKHASVCIQVRPLESSVYTQFAQGRTKRVKLSPAPYIKINLITLKLALDPLQTVSYCLEISE